MELIPVRKIFFQRIVIKTNTCPSEPLVLCSGQLCRKCKEINHVRCWPVLQIMAASPIEHSNLGKSMPVHKTVVHDSAIYNQYMPKRIISSL
jgi:hypothetical protein